MVALCNVYWDVIRCPFSRGGLRLRSAVLTTNAARLDELGSQPPRDPETSICGGSDFARVVPPVCCRTPKLQQRERQAFPWTYVAEGLRPLVLGPQALAADVFKRSQTTSINAFNTLQRDLEGDTKPVERLTQDEDSLVRHLLAHPVLSS